MKKWLVLVLILIGGTVLIQSADKKVTPIKFQKLDPKEAAQVSYTRQIKPILLNHCIECHSAEDHKSNFEVTSVATLLKAGKKGGAGVVPGKPDDSAIVQYIAGLKE